MQIINKYEGIEIRAAAGVHEESIAVINKILKPGARVLDIAAGKGAFSRRLKDAGYFVEANEIEKDAFEPLDINCSAIDLNYPFAQNFGYDHYDLIAAIEIIEHLNNPAMFLNECKKILRKDSYLLITNPNILDKISRIKFLRRGQFCHFEPNSFYKTGHRTILPAWLLELFFKEAGMEIITMQYIGDKPEIRGNFIKGVFHTIVTNVLSIFMFSKEKGELSKNCILHLLKK